MTLCLFASDLHGKVDRYTRLFHAVEKRRPAGVFLGGDLLPPWSLALTLGASSSPDFVIDFLAHSLERLKGKLQDQYPEVFIILGNDDPRFEEERVLDVAKQGLWTYAHERNLAFGGYRVIGYSFIPPSPFSLKDWERYDISRYVDPGCVSPEEGRRTVAVPARETRYSTIKKDLARIATGASGFDRTVLLFHTPPYRTRLDRAPLDGRQIDHVPLDVHVGSVAVRKFIESHQPLVTLHGHVHESARLTGSWKDRIGRTWMFSAAHDGPELSLVSFDLENLKDANRELL